jgi:3',5'-cyclic AMP phosphodiesterase CpdA
MVALGLPVLSAVFSAEASATPDCGDTRSHIGRSIANGDDVAFDLSGATRLLRFGNLSDSHIIDDEASSVYYHQETEIVLDPTIGNNSAQRLQEEFTDEVLNEMVATLNACDAADGLAFMVATGDLTDNAQLNEVRRYIDNLGGTTGFSTAYEANCGYVTHHSTETPKAGLEPLSGEACPIPDEVLALPTGRLTSDAQSRTPDPDNDFLDGFRPTASLRQIAEAEVASTTNPDGSSSHLAPGLPPALRCTDGETGCANAALTVPHYATFGNHDGYPRGTVPFQQPFQAGPAADGRYWLESQREFINEYFFSNGVNPGHGFDHVRDDEPGRWNNADDRDDGYYAFTENGVRIIVMNTIYDGVLEDVHGGGQVTEATGGHLTGNEVTNAMALETGVMDHGQFAWLQAQLAAAATSDTPVLVFSHHPDVSFSESRLPEPIVGVSAAELNHALGEHGNVVAWIAGHTHRHRIRVCEDACVRNGRASDVANPFWQVETASLVDYPQEGRIVELFGLDPDDDGDFDSYALKATTLAPTRAAGSAALTSYELSIAEENCSTAAMMDGPMSSGPYDQQRLVEFGRQAQETILEGRPCHGDVENDANSAYGRPTDRDVVLLP